MIAGPPAMRKTHGRIKSIVGMVSITGRRAARASNFTSASWRISAESVLASLPHVATLREARYRDWKKGLPPEPSVLEAAKVALRAGDGLRRQVLRLR